MSPRQSVIHQRLLSVVVRQIASDYGAVVTAFSDDWVFRIEYKRKIFFIHGFRFCLNNSAVGFNAYDKVAAAILLEASHVPVVRHTMLSTSPTIYPCVVKPLTGGGGRAVTYLKDWAAYEAWRVRYAHNERYVLSPFVFINAEYRVVILNQTTLLVYRKEVAHRDTFTKFNLSHGATPSLHINEETRERLDGIARRSVRALGLTVAAVDIVDVGGELVVIEVNDSISLERFALFSPETHALAVDAYSKILQAVLGD